MKKINGNTGLIKEVNIHIIREAIKRKIYATKPQIARETGLTTATVGTVLNDLLEKKEIIEVYEGKSEGGRPAKVYSYNFDLLHLLLLFPFERNNQLFMNISVTNLGDTLLYREEKIIDIVDIGTIKAIVYNIKQRFPKIEMVGFGNPGTNDNDLITFSDYKEIDGLDLSEELSFPVIIENDVNAAAIGFNKRKGITEDYSTVYIFFPESYPPGSAILINNSLYKGFKNSAGEIANIKDFIWNKQVYDDFYKFSSNAVSLVQIMSSIINPNCFILSGNFLTEEHIEEINKLYRTSLPRTLVSEIFLTKNFTTDLIEGLKVLCIKKLFPQIILTRGEK